MSFSTARLPLASAESPYRQSLWIFIGTALEVGMSILGGRITRHSDRPLAFGES